MGQKIAYEAESPKKGMSLAEVRNAIIQAESMSQVNNKPAEECKVTVFVNFTGGIKQLIVEV